MPVWRRAAGATEHYSRCTIRVIGGVGQGLCWRCQASAKGHGRNHSKVRGEMALAIRLGSAQRRLIKSLYITGYNENNTIDLLGLPVQASIIFRVKQVDGVQADIIGFSSFLDPGI